MIDDDGEDAPPSTPMSTNTASSLPGHIERVRAAVRVRRAEPPQGAAPPPATTADGVAGADDAGVDASKDTSLVSTNSDQKSVAIRARNGKGTLQ